MNDRSRDGTTLAILVMVGLLLCGNARALIGMEEHLREVDRSLRFERCERLHKVGPRSSEVPPRSPPREPTSLEGAKGTPGPPAEGSRRPDPATSPARKPPEARVPPPYDRAPEPKKPGSAREADSR